MQGKRFGWLRLLPILLLLAGLGAFFYFRWYTYLSFQTLQTHRTALVAWVHAHIFLASFEFVGTYTLAVAISIPNAVFLTLIGGFLFGPYWGFLYAVFSATLGATILFLAAKTALHDLLRKKTKGRVQSFAKGFQKNAFSYLLFLRLVPLFPFWLVNIIPALLDVDMKTFVLATGIGIMPGTLVYILLGHSIGYILDQGQTPDLGIIFKPTVLLPLIGLALLSCVPIIYRRIKSHGKHH